MRLISVDFYADFGFFKKPDINDTILLTYNMIHKPVVLGTFGAILGLSGHMKSGELPEYYRKLKELKIGVEPIGGGQKKGNFEKILVKYNDSTGFSSSEKGGVLNVLEQILVKPAYRIFVEIDENKELQKTLLYSLQNYKSEFIPYFGKNEFHCWWENYQEYKYLSPESDTFNIKTIFKKQEGKTLKNTKKALEFGFSMGIEKKVEEIYAMFERLPVGFDEKLKQYSELEEFVYTNMVFEKDKFPISENLIKISEYNGRDNVIYIF